MSSTQPKTVRQVGYLDFWPTVLEKHKKFFIVTQNLGPTIDDLFSVAHAESLHKVARHLTKMVANSVGAVLLLGMNGYGIDAVKIGRGNSAAEHSTHSGDGSQVANQDRGSAREG